MIYLFKYLSYFILFLKYLLVLFNWLKRLVIIIIALIAFYSILTVLNVDLLTVVWFVFLFFIHQFECKFFEVVEKFTFIQWFLLVIFGHVFSLKAGVERCLSAENVLWKSLRRFQIDVDIVEFEIFSLIFNNVIIFTWNTYLTQFVIAFVIFWIIKIIYISIKIWKRRQIEVIVGSRTISSLSEIFIWLVRERSSKIFMKLWKMVLIGCHFHVSFIIVYTIAVSSILFYIVAKTFLHFLEKLFMIFRFFIKLIVFIFLRRFFHFQLVLDLVIFHDSYFYI